MDRLASLKLFLAVAEHGSFSEAARRAGVAPAQVSKKIAALEAHLGVRLLERTTRAVSLTPAGASYAAEARPLLTRFEALEEETRSAQAAPAGLIRITAPVIFGARRLAPVVTAFLAEYDGVEARLSLSDRMTDLVDEGFDVGVRIGRLTDSSLIAKRLAPARLVLVAHPDHPAVHALTDPGDLAQYPCVIDWNLANPRRWVFHKGDARVEALVSGRLQVDSAEASQVAVREGRCIGLIPSFVVGDDVASGRLVRLLPDWEPEHRDIFAVFPQNRHVARRVRLFVDHLTHAFGPEPEWDRALL